MRAAAAAALVVLLAGCSAGRPTAATQASGQASGSPSGGIAGVQTFSGLKHDHVLTHVDYPQVPPVGGPHNPRWQKCGVYDQPVPNETAVHSMEHGGIWITYRPDLPAADVQRLASLTSIDPEYVLVSPYPGLRSPVVVTTWGLQLAVDSADDPRIREFAQEHAAGNQGGERGAPCRTSGLTLDQARQAVQGAGS